MWNRFFRLTPLDLARASEVALKYSESPVFAKTLSLSLETFLNYYISASGVLTLHLFE